MSTIQRSVCCLTASPIAESCYWAASHGTSEFYRARAAITRRLIEKHGFTILAVEADWPDAAAVDRYVRHRRSVVSAEPPFQRFPTWMWRNTDVAALIEWMRGHNHQI